MLRVPTPCSGSEEEGRPSLSNTTVPSQVLAKSAQNIGEDTAETSMRRGLPYGSVSQAWMAFSSVIQPPFQDEFQKLLPHIPALQAISVALLFYQNPSIVDF
ncbi:hypothetical protein CBFG_00202 [Clostridiales bacterium 1_7_47FAA]|nr:hypothetical protein CBFG_00202 [Clostridiales bacterium 1_7_47FAA]